MHALTGALKNVGTSLQRCASLYAYYIIILYQWRGRIISENRILKSLLCYFTVRAVQSDRGCAFRIRMSDGRRREIKHNLLRGCIWSEEGGGGLYLMSLLRRVCNIMPRSRATRVHRISEMTVPAFQRTRTKYYNNR